MSPIINSTELINYSTVLNVT